MPYSIPDEAVDALLARTEKSISIDPRCATQVALACRGDLIAFETYGRAPFQSGNGSNERPDGSVGPGESVERKASNDTLFSIYSVTKAVTSAASWILLQEGKLALGDRVAEHIPEFGTRGKEVVTVEQLLIHTAGFPSAQLPRTDWPDPARRLRHFAAWPLEWEPGSRFAYHSGSTMWVLAELITRISGVDYRDFMRARIFEPLGLDHFHVGLVSSEHGRVADVICVGEAMSESKKAASPVDAPVIGESLARDANGADARLAGSPGGGGIATAADIAMFYQGMLSDAEGRSAGGAGIWKPEILREAWTIRSPELIDDITQQLALRGLGVVMAGEAGKLWRGFSEDCSPMAFGHMGAGGQIAWADPQTGLSFAFLTNGAQRNAARQGANGFRLSTLAAACAPH